MRKWREKILLKINVVLYHAVIRSMMKPSSNRAWYIRSQSTEIQLARPND